MKIKLVVDLKKKKKQEKEWNIRNTDIYLSNNKKKW